MGTVKRTKKFGQVCFRGPDYKILPRSSLELYFFYHAVCIISTSLLTLFLSTPGQAHDRRKRCATVGTSFGLVIANVVVTRKLQIIDLHVHFHAKQKKECRKELAKAKGRAGQANGRRRPDPRGVRTCDCFLNINSLAPANCLFSLHPQSTSTELALFPTQHRPPGTLQRPRRHQLPLPHGPEEARVTAVADDVSLRNVPAHHHVVRDGRAREAGDKVPNRPPDCPGRAVAAVGVRPQGDVRGRLHRRPVYEGANLSRRDERQGFAAEDTQGGFLQCFYSWSVRVSNGQW